MPAIYEEVKQIVGSFRGMVCDACGKEDKTGCNDFVLRHHFGYASPADMTHVEAAICDECLWKILHEHVPGAQYEQWE